METTQIIFVAMEVLFCGEMVILRTLLHICGAGARVRINVQTDCHSGALGTESVMLTNPEVRGTDSPCT